MSMSMTMIIYMILHFLKLQPVLPYLEITAGLNQSPDLNPIEMVWAEKKTFIASKFCRNWNEAKDAIIKSLTPKICARFISNLWKVLKTFNP